MNLQLIANPVSGGDARQRIDRAAGLLRAAGATVEVRLTGRRGDARGFAAEAGRAGGFDRVVAAGGDGTLNEIANGLQGSDLPVAFLPLGTVNVFALETGIPLELEPACALAVTGQPRRISLGRINGESFLLMASAPAPLQVRLADGSRHDGFGVVVSNARHYGGRYVVTPKASLDSPQLEVCLFRHGGRLAMLKQALRLGLHLPLRPPAVAFFSTDGVEISGDGIAVQVDGDNWGRLPVIIESQPDALSVVLP